MSTMHYALSAKRKTLIQERCALRRTRQDAAGMGQGVHHGQPVEQPSHGRGRVSLQSAWTSRPAMDRQKNHGWSHTSRPPVPVLAFEGGPLREGF